MRRAAIACLLGIAGLFSAWTAASAASPPLPAALGLVQRDGILYRDGRPYRGVGANYFDLFLRLRRDPADRTSLAGLRRLATAGIPFVRFAVAFGNRDWELFFQDRAEFFRRLDRVFRTAEEAHVGLIPSIFWHFPEFPDAVGESRDQWGNPASRTIARMREATAALVERYRGSPALWAYEFGNEANLKADLPNAANFRKKGGTARDDLTSAAMIVMLREFAAEVRRHDPQRLILAGHSHPRSSAWHNTAEKSWKPDSRPQTLEILRRDNPAPLDTIGIHVYADHPVRTELAGWAADHAEYLRAVRELADHCKRPIFVGEFGIDATHDVASARAAFAQLLAAMEAAGVDLAAFWVFDLPAQNGTWNVTFDNDRAWMLDLSATANRRWNAAAASSRRGD